MTSFNLSCKRAARQFILLAAASQCALATEPIQPAATAPSDESAAIRHHHFKRLNERLTVEPAVLEGRCRYESDIATPPPLNRVALTFDDGPTAPGTENILEVLKKYKIHATFFMIGEKAQQYPELVAKVRAAGHDVVANHSWSHPNFHDIDPARQAGEVLRTDSLTGAEGPKLFRYPYGNSTCETNQLVREHGYKIVGWHIDSCDWAYDRTGAIDAREAISCGVPRQFQNDYVGHVLAAARARRGGIILMHEIHPNTLKSLDAIVAGLLAGGFEFGMVTDADFQPSLR
ncbi:polysaccharide deacetylase family protein [Duganella sp. BJB1802]|uniref:polysaccharide deacetylase family protein n=1 Tax=Duganella sp. BJB1802 TaxID=2744575 RepID=UPI001593F63C|nr:polysaccharide deacetylase family protein [Duganella sp. BJB1802]NVD69034.1 polysaccharide deacetylase family protein [Duganella sp. BJB1802]